MRNTAQRRVYMTVDKAAGQALAAIRKGGGDPNEVLRAGLAAEKRKRELRAKKNLPEVGA